MKSKDRPAYLRVLDLKDPQTTQQTLPGIPAAVDTTPRPSALMNEDHAKVWDELLLEAPPNVIRELNLLTFETLVRATVLYRDACAQVTKYGAVIKSPSGYPIQSPYVPIMNKQAQHIIKASAELGLTLASRLRVKAGSKSNKTSNPFAGLKTLDE